MCNAPIDLAPLVISIIYFLYAFIQAIITVRLMNEKSAPGLMFTIAFVMAPLATGVAIIQGAINFTCFLLNVGRAPNNKIVP